MRQTGCSSRSVRCGGYRADSRTTDVTLVSGKLIFKRCVHLGKCVLSGDPGPLHGCNKETTRWNTWNSKFNSLQARHFSLLPTVHAYSCSIRRAPAAFSRGIIFVYPAD